MCVCVCVRAGDLYVLQTRCWAYAALGSGSGSGRGAGARPKFRVMKNCAWVEDEEWMCGVVCSTVLFCSVLFCGVVGCVGVVGWWIGWTVVCLCVCVLY